MSKELITVVTVCFNAENVIEKTLKSVLEQTYQNLEYIIIDGHSKDSTCRIIEKYRDLFIEKGFLFKFISEKDKGIYDAMNKGIKQATGKWINFMNAGDKFCTPTVIEEVFNRRIADDIKAVYGNTFMIKKNNRKLFRSDAPHVILERMVACHQSIFTDVQDMKKHPFCLDYKIASDYHYMYQLYRRNGRFLPLSINVSDFDAESGLSSINKIACRWECAKIAGTNHTWQCRIKLARKTVEVYAERILYKYLPADLFDTLQQWNHRRLERKHQKRHPMKLIPLGQES